MPTSTSTSTPTSTSTAAVLRSEWIKIRTLRGTVWSLLAVFLLTVGFAVAANAATGDSEADSADFDALFSVFIGLDLGQIAAISFGTMSVSSEYQGGAIRASLTAVPNRGLFYAAKLANVAGLALAMGLATTFVSFLGGSAFLGEAARGPGDGDTLRACLGGAVYLALMALFAAGLTTALRSGLATLSILIPFILVVSMVLGEASGSAADYLPDRAGQQVLYADPPSDLAPLTGLGVTALWAGAAVLTGWWSLRRRDA
ncbi:ABC transporter permease [Streptomyces sp. NPDC041068]|uniref:ABC transporter permease n=1 Tax=Streptomyces sp. NPDC041068 TaxID=3155130 RepID=UPI003400F144